MFCKAEPNKPCISAPPMQPTPSVPPSLHILETPPSLPPPPPTLTPRTAKHQIVMRPSRKAAIAAAAIVFIALLMWGGRFLSGWLLGKKRGYSTVSTQVGHLPPHPANVGLGGGAAASWMDWTAGPEAAALESSCSVGGSSDATGQSPGLATPSAEPSDSASVMHNELSTQLSPLTGDRAPPTTAAGTGTVAGAGAQAGTLSEENEADEIYHL